MCCSIYKVEIISLAAFKRLNIVLRLAIKMYDQTHQVLKNATFSVS